MLALIRLTIFFESCLNGQHLMKTSIVPKFLTYRKPNEISHVRKFLILDSSHMSSEFRPTSMKILENFIMLKLMYSMGQDTYIDYD